MPDRMVVERMLTRMNGLAQDKIRPVLEMFTRCTPGAKLHSEFRAARARSYP